MEGDAEGVSAGMIADAVRFGSGPLLLEALLGLAEEHPEQADPLFARALAVPSGDHAIPRI